MLWLIVGAALVFGAGTVFLVMRGDDEVVAARPWVPPAVASPFNTNEFGEAEIQEHCLDPGGKQTVIAYERFKQLFAEQPELVKLARPEALPASVTLVPAGGVYPGDLANALTDELSGIDSVSAGCELPE